MESGEWRYGQTDGDRPWARGATSTGATSTSAESPPSDSPDGEAFSTPAPNLWVDDPENAWGGTQSWVPRQRSERPDPDERVILEPEAWFRPPVTSEWGQPRHSATSGAPEAPGTPPAGSPATPYEAAAPYAPAAQYEPPGAYTPPAPYGWSETPASPVAPLATPAESYPTTPTGRYSSGAREPVTGGFAGGGVVAGAQDSAAPLGRTRGRSAADHDRDSSAEEPEYGPVLGYTGAWYGLPAVLHLIWLVTLEGDRQALAGRALVASLPWLAAALVVSLVVAGLLRWMVLGWRSLTVSFAAAVIGAGVTTIAHSLVN